MDRKLKAHFKKHQDSYALLGLGAAMGISVTVLFRGKAKPDEAKIIWKWMETEAAKGINIYGLTNSQKELWESTWAYVNAVTNETAHSLTEVMSSFSAYNRDFVKSSPARLAA